MKSMYDIPPAAEIVQDQYGDECFINIVFMPDGTIWVNTLGERELSGPYHCDDDEAVRRHMRRKSRLIRLIMTAVRNWRVTSIGKNTPGPEEPIVRHGQGEYEQTYRLISPFDYTTDEHGENHD